MVQTAFLLCSVQLGLLLACQWLLDLRVKLWEGHGKDGGVTRESNRGFYQDLDTLSQLVTLVPDATSRVSQEMVS